MHVSKKKYLVDVFYLQCYIKKLKKKPHLAIVTRRYYKSTETVFMKRLHLY